MPLPSRTGLSKQQLGPALRAARAFGAACVAAVALALLPFHAAADCPAGGQADGWFDFSSLTCESITGGADPGGGSGSGTANPLQVVGTQMVLDIHDLRIADADGTNGESIEITQELAGGDSIRGGLFASRSQVSAVYDHKRYVITHITPYLWISGTTDVSCGADWPVWISMDEDHQPYPAGPFDPPEMVDNAVAWGVRLTHRRGACRAANLGLCQGWDQAGFDYQLFISWSETVYDPESPPVFNRVVLHSTDFHPLASAIHRVENAYHSTQLGGGDSSASNILHVTMREHKFYYLGCGNCLEGCDSFHPNRCWARCPGMNDSNNWMLAIDNIESMDALWIQRWNYYGMWDSSYHPPPTTPDWCPEMAGPGCVQVGFSAGDAELRPTGRVGALRDRRKGALPSQSGEASPPHTSPCLLLTLLAVPRISMTRQ